MRLERNGARLVRWVYNVRPEDRIYEKELNTSLKTEQHDGVVTG